ncbi:response regulator [Cryobacterium sp. Hh7]|uniref:response regulator n=1 Tax=Cryobacterium sp. Hh7 TaxID=1259159 RepID=UPI00106B75F3|nr:response regulator [Cryobacterium sp. Hh7]
MRNGFTAPSESFMNSFRPVTYTDNRVENNSEWRSSTDDAGTPFDGAVSSSANGRPRRAGRTTTDGDPLADTASAPNPSAVVRASSGSGPQQSLIPGDENDTALGEGSLPEVIATADHDSKFFFPGLRDGVTEVAESGATSTALVVEDDHKSAKLVRLFLEAEGFVVVVASTGEEALVLARKIPLNLITLDVKLPGIDGWNFLLQLHDSPKFASIPVVVIAGDADMSVALSRGAAAVLEKPLQRAELQNSLALLGLRPNRSYPRRILVVDEDRETIEQVTSDVEKPTYCVKSAETGDAAITDEEQDTVDSDPGQPVVAMNKPDLNREAFLAEIERALE